ncbi:MAG: hypothetical protein AAB502_10995, partial [Chloroflexota bacterium]
MTEQTNPQIVALIQQKLEAAQRRIAELDQKTIDILTERTSLKQVINACQTILAHEQGQDIAGAKPTAVTDERIRQAHMWQSTGRKPGNRNPRMPPRVERFQNTSIQKAIETLAAEFGVARHARDFAQG